jgi:peptidoglycan/LPS O-acetylase OafA/YrhL
MVINHPSRSIQSFDNNRSFGLDVFRALAVLFVLIGHCLEHSKVSVEIKTFGHLGILGVELFFVLSGFLIGSIIIRLIEENKFHTLLDVSTFWKRRWLRTLPLYFVVLLAFLRFDYNGRHSLFDYPTYFAFMQNFSYAIPHFFELSWSLAIEEHFYFWFPLVFLIWKKIIKNIQATIALSALTFIAIAYFYRLQYPLFTDWENYNRSIRMVVLARIDAIMFGVLIAVLKRYSSKGFNFVKTCTPITGLLFLVVCSWWFVNVPHLMQSKFLQIHLFTIQAILCALLIPWFDSLRSNDSTNGFFELTSKLSYSLYLTHILVIVAVNQLLQKIGFFESVYSNPFIIYPVYFGGFYFLAWITYNLIEKPFLELRNLPMTIKSVGKASGVAICSSIALITFF